MYQKYSSTNNPYGETIIKDSYGHNFGNDNAVPNNNLMVMHVG